MAASAIPGGYYWAPNFYNSKNEGESESLRSEIWTRPPCHKICLSASASNIMLVLKPITAGLFSVNSD